MLDKIQKYKKIILIALAIAVLFGANTVYKMYKKANPEFEYKIVKLEKRDLEKTVSVDGQVVADYEISLASEIPGIISKVYVKDGQYVKKGQLLMKLKDADYRNNINSAYAVQKINEASYQKVKNPNQNLELDRQVIEDSREVVLENIEKTKFDINANVDSLEIYLSQILRMEVDDYFDHTEFDGGYATSPVFTYRIKSEIETSRLEEERERLGEDFKKYKESKKTLENSIEIIGKFEKMVFGLYKNSIDFLGFNNSELERREKTLSALKNQIAGKKNSLVALKTQLAQLQKQVDSNFKTEKKLENVVNPADLKLASERIRQAKIQKNNAYTQLQKTYIRAPKSGVVVSVFKESGEYAGPSVPLIKISSLKKYLEVDVPEVDIAKVKKEMKAEIKIDAFGDKIFTGKIDFIYPEKKEIFGIVYYKARILFDGED